MTCGYDWEHRIAKGDAYLEIEDGTGKKRVRCATCATRHETHVIEEPVTQVSADPVGPGDARVDDWGGADGEEPPLDDESQLEPELEGEPW
jgi:hypothetical protein